MMHYTLNISPFAAEFFDMPPTHTNKSMTDLVRGAFPGCFDIYQSYIYIPAQCPITDDDMRGKLTGQIVAQSQNGRITERKSVDLGVIERVV